jgi:hypothetical protein
MKYPTLQEQLKNDLNLPDEANEHHIIAKINQDKLYISLLENKLIEIENIIDTYLYKRGFGVVKIERENLLNIKQKIACCLGENR